MSVLSKIQAELKAPKNQYNSFGKYHYRNCEDILLALKPILQAEGCSISISDEIVLIGDRYYVRATARLKNNGDIVEESTAYAREAESKKGMDPAQLTGATSSYARKYALNGLFAIDDAKDADSMKPEEPQPKPKEKKPKSKFDFLKVIGKMKKELYDLLGDHTHYYAVLGAVGFEHSNEITDRKQQETFYRMLAKEIEETKREVGNAE